MKIVLALSLVFLQFGKNLLNYWLLENKYLWY